MMTRKAHMLHRLAWAFFALWLGIAPVLAGERGLLWKIEPPGAPPSFLFGTIHTDDARVTEFTPELKQAMRQTESFMMEALPMQDASALFMPNGSLRDLLRPEELERVRQLADEYAMREDTVLRLKPWLLATVFSLPQPQSPWTQDILLYSMARDERKQLLGLETGAEHFGMLDDLAGEEQLVLLRAVLAQTQAQKAEAYEAILQAYLDKDLERILNADEKTMAQDLPKELWAKVKTRLLDERNERMAQRIAQQATRAPVFVAVGAAHLSGANGLVALLRKAGFRLSVLQ